MRTAREDIYRTIALIYLRMLDKAEGVKRTKAEREAELAKLFSKLAEKY